jgi:hypothetical protein
MSEQKFVPEAAGLGAGVPSDLRERVASLETALETALQEIRPTGERDLTMASV